MCRVLLNISSCEWWLLNQFVALVYLESVLTISGHPNRVSIIVGWCCVRVCRRFCGGLVVLLRAWSQLDVVLCMFYWYPMGF